MICPCKDCGDRQIGCHSSCDRYAEYNSENIKRRNERQLDYKCFEVNLRGRIQAAKEKMGRSYTLNGHKRKA